MDPLVERYLGPCLGNLVRRVSIRSRKSDNRQVLEEVKVAQVHLAFIRGCQFSPLACYGDHLYTHHDLVKLHNSLL